MRESFSFNLRDESGSWLATCKSPGFVFMKDSESDAIQEALARWVRDLKTRNRYPKGRPIVDKVEKYVGSTTLRKFGGLPVKDRSPHKTVTASVEV